MGGSNYLAVTEKRFKLYKYCGFVPITIINKKSVTKPTDLFFSVFCLILCVLSVFLSLKYEDLLNTSKNEIADKGAFVTYVSSLLIAIFCLAVGIAQRHKPWKIVLLLHEVDLLLGDMRLDFSRASRMFEAGYAFVSCLSLPTTFFFYLMDGSLIKSLLYFFSGFGFVIMVSAVVFFFGGIFVRIRNINANLKIMINNSKVRDFNGKCGSRKIAKCIQVYGKLIDANRLLNQCFGVQGMLGFGVLFFFTIFTSFMAFKDITTEGTLAGVTAGSVVFVLYLQTYSLTLILICHVTGQESSETVKLCNALMKVTKDDLMIQTLISLSAMVNRNKPKYSCGLFDFDWKLIGGVSEFYLLSRPYLIVAISDAVIVAIKFHYFSAVRYRFKAN